MRFLKFSFLVIVFQIIYTVAEGQSREQKRYEKIIDNAKELRYGGKIDEAIASLTKAIADNPANADFYFERAETYAMKVENDNAIADYTEAIRLRPEMTRAWHGRGEIYFNMDEYDKAIGDCTEALRINPTFYFSLAVRAQAYFYKDESDKAIADCTEAIRLKPDFTIAWNARGNNYRDIGEYDKAIADYKEAIRLNSTYDAGYGRAHINIIAPLVREFQFDSAKVYYNLYKSKNLHTYIEHPKWHFYTYYITAATEDIPNRNFDTALLHLDEALKEYATEKIEKTQKGYYDILSLQGYILEQLKRFPEAKDVYNQALAINSNQPDVKEALLRLENKKIIIDQADKLPPKIELLSPQAARGLTVVPAGESTQIIGRAKDDSGIEQVSINGKIIKAEEDGLFVSTLTLKPGVNDILILATDKQGNKAEKTFTITANVSAKPDNIPVEIVIPVNGTPQYHAILIAEKDYADKSIPDLENPVKDAKELSAILQSSYTFRPENIDTLYNSSREEIMEAIVRKCNKLTENDNLLIFYAGHGIAEKDKFGDVDGYWIPSSAKKGLNASYISADDINKALKRSNSMHILVIADACFSGSFTRTLDNDASAGIQKQYNVPSRKVMASGNLEPVPDNSRFIYYLKKNLKENKEKYLTAKKLFDSFYEAILNNSSTSPQYAPIKNVGDEGGEFVFIRKE